MTCNFTKEVLARLRKGERISALEATRWTGVSSTKLTSRISTWRALGWPIDDYWMKSPLTGKRFKVYFMKKGAKQK